MQRERDAEEMVEDFLAAVDFIGAHPDCTGKVGTVGFCFGGGMSLRMAVQVPTLSAAVSYYGRHPEASDASAIKAPLMLHHGELDERVNASWPAFEIGLQGADAKYVHHDYSGANHGFHNDTTPRYDEESALLSWQRTTGFFAQHLDLGD
jgi:carboxymethylenebutenolidase